MSTLPTPVPTPLTQPFWEATRAGELRLQFCLNCERFVFYPRRLCSHCHSGRLEWRPVSGDAELLTYVINYRTATDDGTTGHRIIAIVGLREGPRMLSNLVNVEADPDLLKIGMPLTVAFEQRGREWLPVFAPNDGLRS